MRFLTLCPRLALWSWHLHVCVPASFLALVYAYVFVMFVFVLIFMYLCDCVLSLYVCRCMSGCAWFSCMATSNFFLNVKFVSLYLSVITYLSNWIFSVFLSANNFWYRHARQDKRRQEKGMLLVHLLVLNVYILKAAAYPVIVWFAVFSSRDYVLCVIPEFIWGLLSFFIIIFYLT